MREDRDRHKPMVNPTGENERSGEAARVGRIYAGYRGSRRRRKAWSAENPGNRAMREELLRAVRREAAPELSGGAPLLDVGCGTGHWLVELRASGVPPDRLVGVDVLPDRVTDAERRVPGATVRQADARELPFEAGSFALVLLFTVLSSLATPADGQRALGEACRVLRPSGLLLCYEPRFPSPLNRHARRIRDAELDAAGIAPRDERRLTLIPPLARRLGSRTGAVYPRLAQFPLLQSHRLISYRKDRGWAGTSATGSVAWPGSDVVA